MKKYKPLDSIRFLLVMLVVVALIAIFAPKANADPGEVMPGERIVIGKAAACFVFTINSSFEGDAKKRMVARYSGPLQYAYAQHPKLVMGLIDQAKAGLAQTVRVNYDIRDGRDLTTLEIKLTADKLFSSLCTWSA